MRGIECACALSNPPSLSRVGGRGDRRGQLAPDFTLEVIHRGDPGNRIRLSAAAFASKYGTPFPGPAERFFVVVAVVEIDALERTRIPLRVDAD